MQIVYRLRLLARVSRHGTNESHHGHDFIERDADLQTHVEGGRGAGDHSNVDSFCQPASHRIDVVEIVEIHSGPYKEVRSAGMLATS